MIPVAKLAPPQSIFRQNNNSWHMSHLGLEIGPRQVRRRAHAHTFGRGGRPRAAPAASPQADGEGGGEDGAQQHQEGQPGLQEPCTAGRRATGTNLGPGAVTAATHLRGSAA